jgi:glucokinase
MILAGDIGGTTTVIALCESAGGQLQVVRDATFKSQAHASLEEILLEFLGQGPRPVLKAGCFGVAGAVIEGQCKTTNLPWHLDERKLAAAIGAPRAKLLNDLESAAYGMLFLQRDELCVLHAGVQPRRKGNVAVIAAGTGLGEAMLYWDGQRHHPMASEGGHADFAPQNDQEVDLLRYLWEKLGGHASYERVLSGPGFYNIYRFLRDRGYYPEPAWLTERLQKGDPSAIISQAGLSGEDPLCVATLDLFSSLYGSEAGNLALKCFAIGGVFVGGGIAPKMLSVLQNGSFLRAFTNKGRFGELMKNTEVSVALNPRAPLLGAAHYALSLS